MALGVTFFVIGVLILAVWFVLEFKRFRHKFFAIFLIVLILFTYFSFSYVLKGKNVNIGTVPGFIQAGKLYFSWLGSIFGNFKMITTNAIKMDWTSGNKTSSG